MTAAFVSSTSLDLPEYRAAVRRACDELALGVVGTEDFETAELDAGCVEELRRRLEA